MKNTVIILGARGRFGRAALDAFVKAGWNVRATYRPGSPISVPDSVQAAEVDATDPGALQAACRGQDIIVNALNPPYDKWEKEVPKLTTSVIAAARASQATVLIPGNVYNFGPDLPSELTERTPQAGQGKGKIRQEMEAAYRQAGVKTIVLRAGDFIERQRTGNWFDSIMTKDIERGRVTYPGPLDRVHTWAYLPDMAQVAAALCARSNELPHFCDVPFPGYALTGRDLLDAIERVTGRPLQHKVFPWWALRIMSPFSPLLREVYAMKYLWDKPHRLSGQRLKELLPEFSPTPIEQALYAVLPLRAAPSTSSSSSSSAPLATRTSP